MAPQDVLLIHLVQGLHKDGLLADAAADGHLFQIQQDVQVVDLHGNGPAEAAQSLVGLGLPGVDRLKEDASIHGCIGGQALAGAVTAQQAAGTALAGNALCGVAPGIGVGVHKAVLPCRAVPAAHQLPINDQAAAHTGADDEHCCVPAALQHTPLQLCNGGRFAVILDPDMAAAGLGQPGADRRAHIVGQRGCPAALDHALLGIDEAGQAQGNAVHLALVGQVDLPQGVQEVFLRIRRGGRAARIGPVQLLIHHGILDPGAAHIKNHYFHVQTLLRFFSIIANRSPNVKSHALRHAGKQKIPRCGKAKRSAGTKIA